MTSAADGVTGLTPDHHLCSECYDRYPIGSGEFYEVTTAGQLGWVPADSASAAGGRVGYGRRRAQHCPVVA
ncbi:hypothetical protein [Nocardia veterana]|uniref:Uncharacterized protein n=1 Tax=Nocardia veterana TaxID=132249 RepID=A0A7X6M4X3_9NOCA|nr:hypothetical protein [Nocardia veterana]NKY89909.1 hypothetical protein [Nocardia veterana]